MRDRENGDERDVEQLLAAIEHETAGLGKHELRSMARAAATTERQRGPAGTRRLHRRAFAPRWIAAAVAVALLVGSGLGFGLGSSLTTTETARASFAGTGFLPERGWSVMQSGTVDAKGASRAIAANVPLRPEDDASDIPYATLESLPPRGLVIVATFTTRGDPGQDFAYPVRTLPLQMADASPAPASVLLPRPLGELRLKAAIRGTNVDAQIFIRSAEPSAATIAAAQRQLDRLAVVSERVTLFARPSIAGGAVNAIDLFGSVEGGKAGETVTIQAKDCGTQFFRAVAGAETRDGGGWSTQYYPGINTTLRAVWNDSASAQIGLKQRVRISLIKRRSGGEYYVAAGGRRSFWRKKVSIQRRLGSRWTTVKTVVLTETHSTKGYYSGSGASAEFTVALPKGTTIRAVMPLSQVKPCYLAGVSQTVRT